MAPTPKLYLGNAVYAVFDGHKIILTDGMNKICLEPQVIEALELFKATAYGKPIEKHS